MPEIVIEYIAKISIKNWRSQVTWNIEDYSYFPQFSCECFGSALKQLPSKPRLYLHR
jgi:hypothetical protein